MQNQESSSADVQQNTTTAATAAATTTSNKACLSCKNSHKKCDKLLPTCTRCQQKSLHCNYMYQTNTNNNNRLKNINRNHPYSTNQTNQTNQQQQATTTISPAHNNASSSSNSLNVKQLLKYNTIQMYCEIICYGAPAFSIQQLEQWINLDSASLFNTNRIELLAYLLSIQALCEQRFGFLDFSERSIERSRHVLKNVYERVDTNALVACTYNHLAFYYASQMDRKRARFYLSGSEHFLSELQIYAKLNNLDSTNSSYQEILEHRNSNENSQTSEIMNVKNFIVFKNVVATLASQSNPLPPPISDEILESTFQQVVGLKIPSELKKYLNLTGRLQQQNSENDTDGLSSTSAQNSGEQREEEEEEFFTTLETLEERIRGFETLFNMMTCSLKQAVRSSVCKKMHEFVQLSMFNGVRIICISMTAGKMSSSTTTTNEKSGGEEEWIKLLEQSALALTEASQTDYFTFISPLMIPYYLAGQSVNLSILKSILAGERENFQPFPRIHSGKIGIPELFTEEEAGGFDGGGLVDYVQVVRKDLKALKVLVDRYRYVNSYVEQCEQALKQVTDSSSSVNNTVGGSSDGSSAGCGGGDGIQQPLDSGSNQSIKSRTLNYYLQMRKFLLGVNEKIEKFLPPNNEVSVVEEQQPEEEKDEMLLEMMIEMLNSGNGDGNGDDIDPFLCQEMDISEFNSYFL